MFRTEISIPPLASKISLQSRLLLVGSCFSDNIGQRLKENKFTVSANPFGVIFNPVSLFKLLIHSLTNTPLPESFQVQSGEVWYHYGLHSEVAALSAEELREKTAALLHNTGSFLGHMSTQHADQHFLVITLGTAWVYELKASREVVANCHKMPAVLFEKRLLSVNEIVASFGELYKLLPDHLNILLTVSPVRHVKDTLPLNAVSKSVLRLAVHELCEHYDRVAYFPAYEIMMDDLRDYRFYTPDMLHPTEQAIDYIFDKFGQACFDKEAADFLKKWHRLQQSLHHRAFHPQSASHQQFLRKLLGELCTISQVDVSEEIAQVSAQIL